MSNFKKFKFYPFEKNLKRSKSKVAFEEGKEAFRCFISTGIPILCKYTYNQPEWIDWHKGYDYEKKRIKKLNKIVKGENNGIINIQ